MGWAGWAGVCGVVGHAVGMIVFATLRVVDAYALVGFSSHVWQAGWDGACERLEALVLCVLQSIFPPLHSTGLVFSGGWACLYDTRARLHS